MVKYSGIGGVLASVVAKLLLVNGKAGKLGKSGGGWPPGPPKAPGVKCGPNRRCKVNPGASGVLVIGGEELLISFTDLDDDNVTVVVGTLLVAVLALFSAFTLSATKVLLLSFFANASCLIYSS